MTAGVRSVVALGVVVALLAVVFAVSRDGGGSSPTPSPTASGLAAINGGERVVPAGWTVHSATGYSFAHPSEWTKSERDTDDGRVIEVNGPKGEGALQRQVVVAVQPNFSGDLDGLVKASEFVRTLPQQVVVRDERVTIDGVEAQLTERTWQAPNTAGGNTQARIVELRVITRDRLFIGFLVRSAEADFEAARLREVFASFRLAS